MARRAGISLGTKLVLSTVFLLAAAVATSAWYSLTTLEQLARAAGDARKADLERAIDREAQLLARNAAASASSLLATSDYTRLEETARRLVAENSNVKWLALIESDGRVAASSKDAPAKQGEPLIDALTKKLAEASSGKVEKMQDPGNADRLILGAPVYLVDSDNKDVRVGEVRLAVDISALEIAKQEAIEEGRKLSKESARRQLMFAGIILLVGILLGSWQGVRIARPLRALSEQARHIAGGDFARRAEVNRRDEVGELAETFNMMAQSLGIMVEEVSRKAGLEREIEVARSIQGLMTPPADVMTLGRFKLTGRCEMASACGGDWWSYRQLSDGRLLVVVGDVTGHGMPSAMIAATARGAVEALSMVDHGSLTAKVVLQAIDRAIRDVGGRRLLMTSFALVISPDGLVAYANAGHTFPYVVRLNGAQVELSILPMRSNPLGSSNPLIATGEHQMGPGNIMVLTSDGLTDRIAENGTRFGDKRLRKTLVDQVSKGTSDIASICDHIVEAVNHFGGQQPVDDDITLVVVQYTGALDSGGARPRSNSGQREVAA